MLLVSAAEPLQLKSTSLGEAWLMLERSNSMQSKFEKKLLNLTSQMSKEEKLNLLSYASQLCEQRNQEQHFSHHRSSKK